MGPLGPVRLPTDDGDGSHCAEPFSRGANFCTQTTTVRMPIHSKFITPMANPFSISSQQQPTQ